MLWKLSFSCTIQQWNKWAPKRLPLGDLGYMMHVLHVAPGYGLLQLWGSWCGSVAKPPDSRIWLQQDNLTDKLETYHAASSVKKKKNLKLNYYLLGRIILVLFGRPLLLRVALVATALHRCILIVNNSWVALLMTHLFPTQLIFLTTYVAMVLSWIMNFLLRKSYLA